MNSITTIEIKEKPLLKRWIAGELPMWVTYWGFHFIGNIIFTIIFESLNIWSKKDANPCLFLPFWALAMLFLFIYGWSDTIALWRCFDRRLIEKPNRNGFVSFLLVIHVIGGVMGMVIFSALAAIGIIYLIIEVTCFLIGP